MSAQLQLPRTRAEDKTVRRPNLGVYLDRPSLDMDERALSDCRNVRIKNKSITNDGMGWENFPQGASNTDRINLDGRQVLLIDRYFSRSGTQTLIFCNQKDIFRFNPLNVPPDVTYMTPVYTTGTAACAGSTTTVTGGGTEKWKTAKTTTPTAGGYGDNVRAGDYIHFGVADEDDPAAEWHEIASVTNDTTLELVADPGVKVAGPYTIRQCLTGANGDLFDAVIFQDSQSAPHVGEDVYYITNGTEMLEWDGITATFTWFYPGFVCRAWLIYKQTLVALYIIESGEFKPGTIRYADALYPRDWTGGSAGEITPSDGVSDLLTAIPIGDQIALYYNRDVVLLQYVGEPVVYIARVAVPGLGLAGAGAIMDFGDYHEFLSSDAAYSFDGVGIEEAGQQVFREVLRQAAPNRIHRSYAHIDEENGEVIWSIPLTTDGQAVDQEPTTAYVSHYLEDVGDNLPTPMTIRDFPFTAAGFYEQTGSKRFSDIPKDATGEFLASSLKFNDRAYQDAFPYNIVGDASGDIYLLGLVNNKNGNAIYSRVNFPKFVVADGDYNGFIRRIEPFVTQKSGYDLSIFVKTYDAAEGPNVDSQGVTFDMSFAGERFAPLRIGGRFADIQFYTSGVNRPWTLSGYKAKVSPMGDR